MCQMSWDDTVAFNTPRVMGTLNVKPTKSSFRMTESAHLTVGEEYLLRLKGLGSAGYLWDFILEAGATLVSVARMPTEKPALEVSATPTSHSADSLFSIRALAPGQARIRFMLQRPWLIGKMPPLREHVLEIMIQ